MPPGRVGNKAQRGDISVWLHPLVSKAQVFSDAPMCVCMGGGLLSEEIWGRILRLKNPQTKHWKNKEGSECALKKYERREEVRKDEAGPWILSCPL